MASAKLHKPANETSSHPHEEHKFSQKISEMTAKVFGQKQQGSHETAKHCSTCHCPPPPHKKEHTITVSGKDTKTNYASVEAKKKEKEGHGKHTTTCIELKKKERHHVTAPPTKESNTLIKKENKDKPAHSSYFSSMTDHLKEKVMMMKKNKEGKGKDCSSSDSDSSDSEHEASGKKKQKSKMHTQETKHVSK